MKRVTINDIARLSGVSKATVSEVINNDPKSRVSPETFAKVKKVIDECGYQPLQQAQAMSNGRTRHIGLLISSSAMLGFANSYFGTILAGVENACGARNYYCTVSLFDLAKLRDFLAPQNLRRRNVDALIVAGEIASEEFLLAMGIPVAILGYSHHEEFYRIDRGNSPLGAFRHLAELGHREVLLPYFAEAERLETEAILKEFNRTGKHKINGHFSNSFLDIGDLRRGRELCNEVFVHKYNGCTAMIANDQICSGFMQQLVSLGRKCPDDFSVVSRDDTPLCEWNSIPITACGGDVFEYGRAAANLMIDLLDQTADPACREIKLPSPPEIIIRQTTCRIKPKQS